jgi:XTP/dITP diphosphohydrolase
MQIILASSNAHKAKEFQEKLQCCSTEVLLCSTLGIQVDSSVEQFHTYYRNAEAKCNAVYQQLKNPDSSMIVADDSGLEVPILGNIPGVHSARFASTGLDKDNRKKLLQLLQSYTFAQKKCHFKCVLCCRYQNRSYYFDGRVTGYILGYERGHEGFGYDPIFYYPPFSKTFAEIPSELKNQVSHRGRALEKLKMFLELYQRWDSNPHEV